jgi:hypothetical protein
VAARGIVVSSLKHDRTRLRTALRSPPEESAAASDSEITHPVVSAREQPLAPGAYCTAFNGRIRSTPVP